MDCFQISRWQRSAGCLSFSENIEIVQFDFDVGVVVGLGLLEAREA